MKRAYLVCLFPFLTVTFLLSQVNPVPTVDQIVKQSTAATSPSISSRVSSRVSASQADAKTQARILEGYGKLPLSFEANHGQVDSRVKFLSRTGAYTLFLTGDEAVLALSGRAAEKGPPQGLKPASLTASGGTAKAMPFPFVHARKIVDGAESKSGRSMTGILRMKLRNANADAKVIGVDELVGTSNYFIGSDPSKWRTNVPTYAKVKLEGIYPGIDLVYYGNQRQLEYDFVVAPGADPRRIGLDVRGAKQILRGAHGELVFKMGEEEIRWHKPTVYQVNAGRRQEIPAQYAVMDTNRVGFQVEKYDRGRPLYIDPLIYSTYLGGSEDDFGSGIAVDGSGNAYVVGFTESLDFPITPGAFQTTLDGSNDIFVTKFNPAGSALVYSTYLGGSEVNDGLGIAVDNAGDAYVTGLTYSSDFPTTPGAFQTTYAGDQDGFITKLSPSGSALLYSSYLGGSGLNQGSGVAVDNFGDAYITGFTQATNFPVTVGAFQTTCGNPNSCENAFVTEMNPGGSSLVYSTYLGGSYSQASGITVDSDNNAYVTGYTEQGFPTTSGAFDTSYVGGGDVFVTKLNAAGSALVFSTYLGGSSYDQANAIALDQANNAYVTGFTYSANFPVTAGSFRTVCNGGKNCAKDGDAFVAKINASGSALLYSTYLGGTKDDYGTGIFVDGYGNPYVVGITYSKNFPTTPNAVETGCCHVGSAVNAFVTKLNSSFSELAYSTYLEGIANTEGYGIFVDGSGSVYVTGYTEVGGFPVTSGAFQTKYGGGDSDAFVMKIDPMTATTTTLTSSPNPSGQDQLVTFKAVITSALGPPPDGELVSFMKGARVLGTAPLSGGSATFTTTTLKIGTTAVKAVYGGDSNFAGSTSKVVKQVVEKAVA
jgi:Big-like domain-containing protein/beta-propeller repeat-containing protein